MTRRPRVPPPDLAPEASRAPAQGPDLTRLAELAELGIVTGGLLHEIRQPLFAAKGTLELARSEGRAPSVEEMTAALDELRHIEALLDAHTGLGRVDDPAVELGLLAASHRAALSLNHRARSTRAELVVLGEEVRVVARPTAVRQVVLNLVANALDAVDGCAERRVELVVERSADGWAAVRVTDTGPGLADAIRDRLFEPFVTTKPPGRGTGLGLWVARGLVAEAGGTLRATRSDARGTVMEASWPAVSAPEATGGSASS